MHVYNSLVVLKEILPMFPIASVYDLAGPTLQFAIDRLNEKEKRGDLKIFGGAYASGLKKREAFWAPPPKPKVYIRCCNPSCSQLKSSLRHLHQRRRPGLPQHQHLHQEIALVMEQCQRLPVLTLDAQLPHLQARLRLLPEHNWRKSMEMFLRMLTRAQTLLL